MKRILQCAVAITTCWASVSYGQVLHYSESFATDSTTSLSSYNWSGFFGAGATDSSSSTSTADGNFNVPAAPGFDGNLGYGARGGGGGNLGIAFTSDFEPIDLATTSMVTFSYYMRASNANSPSRFLIELDDEWYATVETFSFASPTLWEFESFEFTTDASAWLNVDFTPGSELALGSVLSSDLANGTITSAGLFLENTSVSRFDQFEIVVPEPASATLLIGGLSLLLYRRRKGASL